MAESIFRHRIDCPSETQEEAGMIFLVCYNAINRLLGLGKGAGKTWFWARVMNFLAAQDPFVEDAREC